MQKILLGNEAIAQGAIDAGLSGAYGYPGTPSTEIIEYIKATPQAKSGQIKAHCPLTKRLPWKRHWVCPMPESVPLLR